MFEISKELAQAIANYLASRPYGEVVQLIDALKQLRPVENKKDQASS